MILKIFISIFPALLILLTPPITFAGEPPQLSSPSDGATTTSSKLEWQIPSYPVYSDGSPYMVDVDDDQSFSDPEKNKIYLKNNYYTPQLNPGIWYWRVKAKDSADIWSDWSSVWSFTLTSASPTTSPQTSSNPSPNPSPSTQPSPSSSSSTSSFIISDIPTQINSDQSFSAKINLSLPNNPNTKFYLKGAFKKSDGSNYFGYTLVSSSWIKNGSSYSQQFPITTDSSGNWIGNIDFKVDDEDSGFTGSGSYIFKVGRYSSSRSGPTWSNEININIISTSSPSKTTSQGGTTTSKSTPSQTSSPPIKSVAIKSQSKKFDSSNYQTASVAAATASASPAEDLEVKSEKRFNFIPWIGGVLLLSGIASLIFIYLRNKRNENIRNPL